MTESASKTPGAATQDARSRRAELESRINLRGRTLREQTARGVMINSAFQIGLAGLTLLKQFSVAALLTTSAYGFWGLLLVSLNTLLFLKQVGIGDKYVQQADDDQELAFQRAFTIELFYTLAFYVVILAALPLYALIYGRPEIVGPGLVLSLVLLFSAFQTPQWIFYRQMDFARQRGLEAINPIVALVVTLALAVAGAGYWSLILGALAGGLCAAVAATLASPYRLALRFDRATLRGYFSFSWPLLIVSGSGLLITQAAVIVGEATLGLVGIAVIGLTGVIARFADRVDAIVTRTIYPAVCAVRDRTDLMFESFVKSNRLALMWGMPFGLGLVLFAPDLVAFVLGEKWSAATALLQVFGAIVAAKQIGFNWTAFMRALDRTKPMAVNGVLALVTFMVVGVPLMLAEGLLGYAIGMAAVNLVQLVSRTYFLTQLFPGFSIWRHAARAIAPSVPAAGAILVARLLEGGAGRTAALAAAELSLYVVVTVAATLVFERALLREMWRYLKGGLRPRAGTAA